MSTGLSSGSSMVCNAKIADHFEAVGGAKKYSAKCGKNEGATLNFSLRKILCISFAVKSICLHLNTRNNWSGPDQFKPFYHFLCASLVF